MARQRKFILNNAQIIAPNQRKAVKGFDKGFVDKYDTGMLQPDELYKAVNVDIDLKGTVETRKGVNALLLTVPGNYAIRNLGFFEKEDGTKNMIAVYDDVVSSVNTTDWDMDEIFTDLGTTTAKGDMFSYKDNLYFMNGEDAMQVYDGSTTWEAGLTAPTENPTVAMSRTTPTDSCTAVEGDGTGLTGTYRYKVSYVTAAGEGSAGPANTAITISNKDIDLENIPLGPTGVTSRKIYRTKAYGIVYYLVDTIADNTTEVYTDDTDDGDLGDEAPDDLNLTGEYTYRVAFVYGARGTSSVYDATTAVDVDKGEIALSDIPTGGTGCTARKIYRSVGDGGADTEKLLTTLDDNTTTTYTDNVADADLDVQYVAGDNTPANFAFGLFKKKSATLWAADTANYPNRVYLSEALYPEVFPEDNYINLPNTGDEIIAFAEYFDDLYVFMKRSIFRITGETLETASVGVISQSTGCVARKTVQNLRQDLVFLSYDGLFTLSRVLLSSNSQTVDVNSLSEKVGKTFDGINWENVNMSAAYIYKGKYGLAIPYGENVDYNTKVLEYDIDGKYWVTQTGKLGYGASFIVGDIDGDNELNLYIGSSNAEGQIYSYPGTSYTDAGQAYDSYIITSLFDGDIAESLKRWKSFFVEVEAVGDYDLYVWYRKKPYSQDAVGWLEKTVDMNPNIIQSSGANILFGPGTKPFYPLQVFGSASAPKTILIKSLGKNLSGQSKYIQFKIGNNGEANARFKLYQFTLYYRVKKPRV